jgi:hypothetical protein
LAAGACEGEGNYWQRDKWQYNFKEAGLGSNPCPHGDIKTDEGTTFHSRRHKEH